MANCSRDESSSSHPCSPHPLPAAQWALQLLRTRQTKLSKQSAPQSTDSPRPPATPASSHRADLRIRISVLFYTVIRMAGYGRQGFSFIMTGS